MIIKGTPITGSGAAPPPSPLNTHIYSTSTIASPAPLPSESTGEPQTLCGFEGPEKLLEIWFRPVNGKDNSPVPSRTPSPFNPRNVVLDAVRTTFDSVIDSDIGDCARPNHEYSVSENAYEDNSGKWHFRRTGLRTVERAVWEKMLDIVHCQVLNVVENECVTAYLLSESSMFVYPNRLILKTCGTTTLLHAVPRILAIAAEHCGLRDVNAVFYSRKAFLFPEKQAWPHGRWGDEVSYLDELFPADTFETAGYVLGKINGDHWCLYMATPLQLSLDLDGVEIADSTSSRSDSDGESSSPEDDDEEDDVTLEIMMTNLNSSAMKQFWRTEEEKRAIEVDGERGLKEGAQRVYRQTGIANIYPNAVVDDYLFDPCGYSLNGLVGPYYFTIHVTPEDHCSYASFETTVPVKRFHQHSHGGSESEYDSFDDLIGRVVDVFRPGQFSTTLFTRRSAGHKHRNAAGVLDGNIKGFRRRDRIVQSLGKWDLIFCHYDQGFTGGGKNKKVAGKKGLAAR